MLLALGLCAVLLLLPESRDQPFSPLVPPPTFSNMHGEKGVEGKQIREEVKWWCKLLYLGYSDVLAFHFVNGGIGK